LCSIPSLFRPTHLTYLCIGSSEAFSGYTGVSSIRWHELLVELQALEHLTVIQSDALPPIEALCGGYAADPPCPALESLELRHNRDINSVVSAMGRMVTARRHSRACSPLELMLIVTRYEDEFDPLSAIRLREMAPTEIQVTVGPGDNFQRPDTYLTTEQERSLTG
jgi:hypothetical protein